MTISDIRIYRYELPLRRPLTLRHKIISTRVGLVIGLTDTDCVTGYGECAPLPGVSAESVDEATTQCKLLRQRLLKIAIPENVIGHNNGFERWLYTQNVCLGQRIYPSVRMGLEMAGLNLITSQQQLPLRKLFLEKSAGFVNVNGLIVGTVKEIQSRAIAFVAEGYMTLKIKVGRLPLSEEISLINSVRQAIGTEIKLRLDANRAWSFEDAVSFGKGVAQCEIEYIEEPLADSTRLEELYEQTGMPICLDESLSDANTAKDSPSLTLQVFGGLVAVVIRPTVLGGFERSLLLTKKAADQNITPVVSSAFESSLGIYALASFASALPDPQIACGFDTLSWLADDILSSPLSIADGKIDLGVHDNIQDHICFEKLIEIGNV
ncbi:MAG: o-succinylbenzoate synthase [candidate division Zixibacteria bacterium]|nr:o-succinylbenzoate synthase [candidate division Zixibacteria bacterium]